MKGKTDRELWYTRLRAEFLPKLGGVILAD